MNITAAPAAATLVLVVLVVMSPSAEAKKSFSSSQVKDEQRRGRFLFSIVQFRNDVCNSTATGESGICYTVGECTSKGGSPGSSCAAGFGTCCVFANTCYGIVQEKVAYFRNPSYPDYNTAPNYCTYSVEVTDPDVCQVRLDFDLFEMSGPSVTVPPFGQCNADRMAVFASSQANLGLSEGNLICGVMTGQHMYLPVNVVYGMSDILRLFAMVGNAVPVNSSLIQVAANYAWSIRVEHIDCRAGNPLQAPEGCLQYFTEVAGTIESFNFADALSPYPISTSYAICIKRQPGYCGVNLGTTTVGDFFGLNTNNADPTAGTATDCYDETGLSTQFTADYIEILDGALTDGATLVPSAQFCGVYKEPAGTFPGVRSSFVGPVVIRFTSDEEFTQTSGVPLTTTEAAQTALANGIEYGFRLSYALTPNCF